MSLEAGFVFAVVCSGKVEKINQVSPRERTVVKTVMFYVLESN